MFVPLHVKSDFSFGYGVASVQQLVDRAFALGYPAIALTDLENLYGQVQFHDLCRQRGLEPVTGVELRPGFDGHRRYGRREGRLVLLATSMAGYSNLCRIISQRRGALGPTRKKGFYGEDPLNLLEGRLDGLFALSDDLSVVQHLLAEGFFLKERVGFLVVRPRAMRSEESYREASRKLGIRLVADPDVVFLDEADHALHVLQIAIRQGRRVAEAVGEPDCEEKDRWMRPEKEMIDLFADLPGAVAATSEIARECRFEFETNDSPFSRSGPLPEEDASRRLKQICIDARNRWIAEGKAWTPEHERRLAAELDTYRRLHFSGWMVVVAEIVGRCRAEGIPVAARGSAVSSLALHLLGASPIDPLQHGLIFERFLHEKKSEWPDIDLDLPWHRRDEVIEWVYQRFGPKRVAMAAAYHTFQHRSALQQGLKAWGFGEKLIRSLVRALPPEDLPSEDLPIEEIDFLGLADSLEEGAASDRGPSGGCEQQGLGKALSLCARLVGKPHHVAAHPGGLVITPFPLQDLLPLERAPKGVVITQYDMTALASLGLLKIDLLGNRCLSQVEETLRTAGAESSSHLESIPVEDPETLAAAGRAETLGCFQLESPAMRSLLARIPIRRPADLVAALALIRPGAAAGRAKEVFVRRARGEEPDSILDPVMADRLKETHGMLIYEEDIMLLLSRTGGLSLSEADEFRSAIVRSGGNPAILSRLEAEFLARASLSSLADPGQGRARRAWSEAARFAAYSFNKAHATSYGRLAYLSVYMKVHHLLEFASSLLNHYKGFYPIRAVAGELSRLGVRLLPPHVNHSAYRSGLEDRGANTTAAVRVGLDKIKILSVHRADDLLEQRAARGPFAGLADLLGRVRLPLRELTSLVLSGACDGLPPFAPEAYPFVHEKALELLKQEVSPAEIERLRAQEGFDPDSPDVRLYAAMVRVRNELRYLEMHLSSHPMALLRQEAKRYGSLSVREAVREEAGFSLKLAGIVSAMRRVRVRRGTLQFLTIEDETGLIEGVILPPAYLRIGSRVTTPGPFLIEGILRRRQGAVHMEINEVTPFYKRLNPFGR